MASYALWRGAVSSVLMSSSGPRTTATRPTSGSGTPQRLEPSGPERVYVGAKTFFACLCLMAALLSVAALLLWANG